MRRGTSVRISLELLGPVREALGSSTVDVTLEPGATVYELVEVLVERAGEPLRDLLARCRFAVADRVVDLDEKLCDGEAVVVIPPVSGG